MIKRTQLILSLTLNKHISTYNNKKKIFYENDGLIVYFPSKQNFFVDYRKHTTFNSKFFRLSGRSSMLFLSCKSKKYSNSFGFFVGTAIHCGSDAHTGPGQKFYSFYWSMWLLHRSDKTLIMMVLSQHRVSSFKTVRLRASYGFQCFGRVGITWSAVDSVTLLSHNAI